MSAALVDPLNIQPSQVEAVWKVSKPGSKNGGAVFVGRIEAICKAEAARLGYDQVLIRSIPHDTTTQPGNSSTFISDEMHLTVRFVSKYFAPLGAYERSVHIPVNILDPATGRFTRFETNAKKRGKDYPYGNLAQEKTPTYSHLTENPFPKTMRQQGINRQSRETTPTKNSRPGTPSARPGTPTSRPSSSSGRPAPAPTSGRPAPSTTSSRPGTPSSRPSSSSGLRR